MYIFLLPLVIVTLLTLPVLSRIKHFSDGKKAQRAIIAVANAAPAAIGAVAEEPSSFGKAMIFVALGEGVALYGFLIAFLIIQALA